MKKIPYLFIFYEFVLLVLKNKNNKTTARQDAIAIVCDFYSNWLGHHLLCSEYSKDII